MSHENTPKPTKEDIVFKDECYEIIDCAFTVWKELGYGFLENVYKEALVIELNNKGFNAEVEHSIKVFYKGNPISKYFADILVDRKIILELKTECKLNLNHQAQVINYLKATKIKVGLLINFGKNKCEFKRLIF